MKKILSISLGSSQRDHTTQVEFLGQLCELSRRGTDGDFDKALQLYHQCDGKVDAFGVGGVEFYFQVGCRRYHFRDVKRIRKVIINSKVGDGNGVKGLLAWRAFAALEQHLNIEGKSLKGLKGLIRGLHRYQMAEVMVNAGLDTTFGDFYFSLGIPIKIRTLATVRILASISLPFITQLPSMWLFPSSSKYEQDPVNKFPKLYEDAEVIGGDFLSIYHNLPPDMSGKIIVTNTTTAKNVELLQNRGLKILVTTTPRLEGRSFGTNVMEAALRALCDKSDPEITEADFLDMIERIPLEPNIEILN